MMGTHLDNKIDTFCQTVAEDFLERTSAPGTDVWPEPVFHPGQGNSIIYPRILYDHFRLFTDLMYQGYSIKDLADLFHFPGRTVHQMYFFMQSASTQEEALIRTFNAGIYLAILEEQRNGNPFCEDGVNRVLSDSEFEALLERERVDPNESSVEVNPRDISELVVMLSGYVELLYFAYQSYGREFHGPYALGDNRSVLVREYYDTRPNFYNFASEFPHSSIQIVSVFSDSVGLSCDIAGRIDSDERIGPSLEEVAIYADGSRLNPSEILALKDRVDGVISDASSEIRNMGKADLAKSYLQIHYWVLRPFLKEIGVDNWRPPQKLLKLSERIDDFGDEQIEKMQTLAQLENQQAVNRLARIFDPRIWNDDKKLESIETNWY